VQNLGIRGLSFQEVNLEIGGRVLCQKKSHCVDLVVKLVEVSVRDHKKQFSTKVSKDGTFVFNLMKPGKWEVQI
jgi:hypothetical protein